MNKKKLKEVAGELENASKMHAGQAKKIKSMLKYNIIYFKYRVFLISLRIFYASFKK